jgi:hypothetical protein
MPTGPKGQKRPVWLWPGGAFCGTRHALGAFRFPETRDGPPRAVHCLEGPARFPPAGLSFAAMQRIVNADVRWRSPPLHVLGGPRFSPLSGASYSLFAAITRRPICCSALAFGPTNETSPPLVVSWQAGLLRNSACLGWRRRQRRLRSQNGDPGTQWSEEGNTQP